MGRHGLLLMLCFILIAGLVPAASVRTAPDKATPQYGASQAGAKEALTNDQIVMMVQNKLSDSVIQTAISSAHATAFDTTPSGLLELRSGGVKDKIILDIQRLAQKQAPTGPRIVMTNDLVISMVSGRVKLSEAVVIAAIQNAAETAFDVSPKGLIDLKVGGVNDKVVQMMQRQSSPKPASQPAAAATPAQEAPAKETAAKETPAKEAPAAKESAPAKAAPAGAKPAKPPVKKP